MRRCLELTDDCKFGEEDLRYMLSTLTSEEISRYVLVRRRLVEIAGTVKILKRIMGNNPVNVWIEAAMFLFRLRLELHRTISICEHRVVRHNGGDTTTCMTCLSTKTTYDMMSTDN